MSDRANTPRGASSTSAASETATAGGTNANSETATRAGTNEAGHVNRAVIRVAAALIVDNAGRLLLVRKRGTSVFMQPGGKYEPGETGAETLARELHEELGLTLSPDSLEPLGTFTAPAANEAGMLVEAEVFRAAITESWGAPVAGAEIDELRWVHPLEFGDLAIAPLVTERMLDLLR